MLKKSEFPSLKKDIVNLFIVNSKIVVNLSISSFLTVFSTRFDCIYFCQTRIETTFSDSICLNRPSYSEVLPRVKDKY